jgi:hypothetical protein
LFAEHLKDGVERHKSWAAENVTLAMLNWEWLTPEPPLF